MRILVIEDEVNLADVIVSTLKKEKYLVDVSYDGEDGLFNALTDVYNLIILDVMLPSINGFDILKEIRENKINSKVIMLTAKSELEDKLNGLNHGADDYMTKPFHIEELIARVNIQLRKNENKELTDTLVYNDMSLNIKSSKLENINTKESITLGLKEFQILEYLMQNKDIIVSREQIYDKIWGFDNEVESNNLEVYLSFIRRKLKLIGVNVNIKVIRGVGYKLENINEKA